MIQSPAWRLRQFPQTRVHSLLRIPRQKPCTRHRCCCRILHPPLPDTRPRSPPAPWLLGPPRMLTAPPMSVDFAVPASSVSSEPAPLPLAPTITAMPPAEPDAAAPLLTDTAPVPALVEAPLDTDTPPVLPSSSSPDADSNRTSPLVLPMPPAPEDRVSDPPLTAEAGSREESGFLALSYRWQHVHWARGPTS